MEHIKKDEKTQKGRGFAYRSWIKGCGWDLKES